MRLGTNYIPLNNISIKNLTKDDSLSINEEFLAIWSFLFTD